MDTCTSRAERIGRLNLLRDLANHRAKDVEQPAIRSMYSAIVGKIENGRADWTSDFDAIQTQILAQKNSKPSSHDKNKKDRSSVSTNV